MLNSFGPDQDRQNGEPDLSLKCLYGLSADGSLKKNTFFKSQCMFVPKKTDFSS